jgi:hypothetical protein
MPTFQSSDRPGVVLRPNEVRDDVESFIKLAYERGSAAGSQLVITVHDPSQRVVETDDGATILIGGYADPKDALAEALAGFLRRPEFQKRLINYETDPDAAALTAALSLAKYWGHDATPRFEEPAPDEPAGAVVERLHERGWTDLRLRNQLCAAFAGGGLRWQSVRTADRGVMLSVKGIGPRLLDQFGCVLERCGLETRWVTRDPV